METELKLDYPADRRDALCAALGIDAAAELVSTYYDTPSRRLRAAGFVLRVRSEGGRFIQTVKAEGVAAAGLFARPEWETDVPGGEPVVSDAVGPIVGIVGDEALQPLFATEVSRGMSEVRRGDALVAVAVDAGRVRAAGAEAPIAELELELVAGPVAALFAFARELDAIVPLRLAVRSKSERGWRLAADRQEEATKAEPVRLDPDATATDAFVVIAGACLRHYRLNETRLLAGTATAAALHQARVALRRLRTALSLFEPLFEGDPRTGVFAAELRAIAATLGSVRDLDVLIARHAGPAPEPLVEARRTALGSASAMLESPATRRLMIDLSEWLAIGDWRTRAAAEPARTFAEALLDRRRKRLKRRGSALATLDDDARHRVRIAAKKLRYAAEFFAGLWDGRKARRRHRAFLAAIEALQEELGRLNDAATAQATVARLGIAASPDRIDGPATLARAEDAFDELMDIKRFWR